MTRKRVIAQLELKPLPDPLADAIAAIAAAPIPAPPSGFPSEQQRWREGRAEGVALVITALGYAREHRMTLPAAIAGLGNMPTPRPPRDGFREQQQWCAGHCQAVRDCRRLLMGLQQELERRG